MADGLPQWLISMLDAKFFEPCVEHQIKDYIFFCKDCKGTIFCESCKTKSNVHEGHIVLRVYKASYRIVLRIQDITELFDVSDIHPYTINSRPVVFIHSRQERSPKYRSNAACKCETCGYELLESSRTPSSKKRDSFKFCSISCKAKTKMNSTVDHSSESECARIGISSLTTTGSDQSIQSSGQRFRKETPIDQPFRKRSRKGTPSRSPFF